MDNTAFLADDSPPDKSILAASGSHLRRKLSKLPWRRGASRAFMAVSEEQRGFAHLHDEDEDTMKQAFCAKGCLPFDQTAWEAGLAMLSPDVDGSGRPPTSKEVLGDYVVSGFPTCCDRHGGSKYPVAGFKITDEDVVTADDENVVLRRTLGCAAAHALGEGRIVMHVLLRKKNVSFKPSCLGFILKMMPGEVVYTLTISENGITRFHLPPERGMLAKLLYGYCDSETGLGFFSNIKHALTNGCFCLGMFYASETARGEGARPVLMRFNRWAGDLAPYWAAVRRQD